MSSRSPGEYSRTRHPSPTTAYDFKADQHITIRESREGLPYARQHEPLPRRGVLGSLRDVFRAEKRVHRVKSNRGLVRNTQALQPPKHMATVSEKHEEDRDKPRPASNSNVEKFAHRASESNLLTRSAAELTGALLSLRAENRQLRQACASHTKESQLVSSIREKLAQQEKELALAQEESVRAHTELASVKRKALRSLAQSARSDPYQFDDEHLKGRVITLQYNINRWVRNQSWLLYSPRSVPERYMSLRSTTPHYLDYIDSERGMHLLLGARVWQYLVGNVFKQDIWAAGNDEKVKGQIMNLYWRLKTYLEKTVSEEHADLRHEWRVATARVMAARGSSSTRRALGEAVRERALELRGDLQTFSAGDLDTSSKTKIKLEDLIQESIDLDIIIEQQRPYFFFYPVLPEDPETWSWEFSKNLMVVACDDGKVPLSDQHQQVKLVLSPGLRKHGTSAGRNYEKRSTILKAEVDIMSESEY